jgi:AcrR family transcriptional regulator
MTAPTTRRSSLQVRRDLLQTAAVVFTEKGYAAATSRDLARAAGVSESVLYRHFGSKAGLFAEAVVAPFAEVMEAFSGMVERTVAQPLEVETLMRLFLAELIEQLTTHRRTLRMFLAAEDQLDEDTKALFYARFHSVITRLAEVVEPESRRHNRPHNPLGTDMNTRATLGMVLSLVILDDWLLPPARPTRDQLIDHLGAVLLNGV